MRLAFIILIIITAAPATWAGEIYYSLRHETFVDLESGCDQYIENHSNEFEADLRDVLRTYEENNWDLLEKLIYSYFINGDSASIMKHDFWKMYLSVVPYINLVMA